MSESSGYAVSQTTSYENFSFRSNYALSKQLLGYGAYGRVFKGTSVNGKTVALKEINVPINDQGIPLSTLRELCVLKKIQLFNSPYLVQMLDISLTKQSRGISIYIVFEFVDCDLARYLSHHTPETGLPPETIKNFAEQLLRGTDFLHSHRIIHRDLKPANILIDRQNKRLKITDFGLSRVLGWESSLTPVVVTLWYRAPEILIQSEYLSPCDVWAAGCVIAELFNHQALFPADTELKMLQLIFDTIGFPQTSEWPNLSHLTRSDFASTNRVSKLRSQLMTKDESALDLLERMIQFNPKSRITAYDALALPYFRSEGLHVEPPSTHHSPCLLSSQKVSIKTSSFRSNSRHSRHSMNSICASQSCATGSLSKLSRNSVNAFYHHSRQIDGYDEVDSSVKQRLHSIQRPPNRCSAPVFESTQTPPTNIQDVERHQHDLMLSVVNNAISDSSSNVKSFGAHVTNCDYRSPPHRPVTRQQTRAVRRHTQPTTTLQSDHTTKLPLILKKTCNTSTNINKQSCVQTSAALSQTSTTSTTTKSATNCSITRTGRQRKTARRRTVMGLIGHTGSNTNKQVVNFNHMLKSTISCTKTSVSTVNAASNPLTISTISSNLCNCTPKFSDPVMVDRQQRKQNYHERTFPLTNCDHFVQKCNNHRAQLCSRYSLGGSTSSRGELHSISEQDNSNHVTCNMTSVSSSQIALNDISVDCSVNIEPMCSPSKLPRVASTVSDDNSNTVINNSYDDSNDGVDHVESVKESLATNLICPVLKDEDDEVDNDDNDSVETDDLDSHPVNTSLGINSAMTGLALVNQASYSSTKNKCDFAADYNA